MKLDLNDEEFQFLLEILGQHHAVKWMLGKKKEADLTQDLIAKIVIELENNGKKNIFDKVFQEVKR